MGPDLSFKQRVYQLVKKIPKGKVATYGEIAVKVKSSFSKENGTKLKVQSYGSSRQAPPEAGQARTIMNVSLLARAAGNALHANKDPKVPCHRVVDRNGRIATNFAFGGDDEQRNRLVAEGVKFKDNVYVDLWKEDLLGT